jgi:nucleoside-diphosphate-sugar epimerase
LKPVLVTGAAGFIGSHLVDALLARDIPVRALVRPETDRSWLDASRVTFALGDVGDPSGGDALARAADGCAAVYHIAGITQARRPGDFQRVNADGAGRMASAAAQAGAEKFVLVSSLAAGGPAPGHPRSEADPDRPVGGYGLSKNEGEKQASAAFPYVVSIRPPAVYGPRDKAFLLLFRLALRGVLPLPGGELQRLSFVHGQDLAQALVLAGERAAAGEKFYVASGPPVRSGELADRIGEAVGRKPLRFGVPSVMLKAAVGCAEAWARATGRPVRLTRERLADWTEPDWTVDDSRARTTLGYAPRFDIAQGIADTAAWYRSVGWIAK